MNLEDNTRKYIDLHVHSTASDGTVSPAELVRAAEEQGLYAFALTDHDTVDGIEEALQEAKGKTVKVIPGIEVSAENTGSADFHILGFNIDYKSEAFLTIVKECQNSRENRNRKMIEKIREAGLFVTEEIIRERFPNASITRAHFARFMIDEGFVKSKEEAFSRYLNPGKSCYVQREKISPKLAIELILQAKGHPVLAHPLLYHMGHERLEQAIQYLKTLGLEGIEAIYSLNTPSDDRYLKKIATENGLFVTGGSDYHGSNKPDISLGTGKGNLQIEKELLKNIL